MIRAGALLCLLLAASPVLAAGGSPSSPEEVRGRLSLAWDAYDSDLCGEALGYLSDVSPPQTLAAEAAELRALCLTRLERFAEAAAALSAPAAADIPGWEALWEETILAWASSRQKREDYRGAAKALEIGRKKLADSALLDAASRAVSHRAELSAALVLALGEPRALAGGGVLQVLPSDRSPEGDGWAAWCPPPADAFWIARDGCREWMPSAEERLRKTHKIAWLRISAEDFHHAVRFEAAERGWKAGKGEGDAWHVERDGRRQVLDAEAWRSRASLEGWGLRGAAFLAVAEAVDLSERRETLRLWVKDHAGTLKVADRDETLLVTHPRTGRSFPLDLDGWAGFFQNDPQQWNSFWAEVGEELALPARAFRCFCGREVVLRETLVPDAGGLVTAKGDAKADAKADALPTTDAASPDVVLEAHCPKHWSFVTGDILAGWGVSADEAFRLAGRQAVETPWELSFDRGHAEGQPFLLLAGPSASGLSRRPDVLLGVLNSVEGGGYSGRTVSVWTPTAETLVVSEPGAPDTVGVEGARRAVSYFGGVSPFSGPISNRRAVALPQRAAGSCNLVRMEGQ